jgi:hypothetical protein
MESMGTLDKWKDVTKENNESVISLVSPFSLDLTGTTTDINSTPDEDHLNYDLYQLLLQNDRTDFSIKCRKELLGRVNR